MQEVSDRKAWLKLRDGIGYGAQTSGKPPRDDIIVHIAKLLREDILVDRGQIRQAPVYDDDHDSWDYPDKEENWYYVAASIIKAVDDYRKKQE